MSANELPPLITSEQFKALCDRHGFSQAEAGARQTLNAILLETLNSTTRQAMLLAEHDKKKGLQRKHASAAVEMTPEIPNGIY